MMNDKEKNIPSYLHRGRGRTLKLAAFINGVKAVREGKLLELYQPIEKRKELIDLWYNPKHISDADRKQMKDEREKIAKEIQKMQEARRCGMEMAATAPEADIYDLLSEYTR